MVIPSQYAWLRDVGVLPRIVTEGLKLLGTLEVAGPGNNPTILAWAKEVGLEKIYTADSIPWCGLFKRLIAHRAGKDCSAVTSPLSSLSWTKYGEAGGQPRLGDTLVFIRSGGGHVGVYIAEDKLCYHVLGGNQSDAVTITRIQKSRLHAVRRQYAIGMPASAKMYLVAGTGKISTNEA